MAAWVAKVEPSPHPAKSGLGFRILHVVFRRGAHQSIHWDLCARTSTQPSSGRLRAGRAGK